MQRVFYLSIFIALNFNIIIDAQDRPRLEPFSRQKIANEGSKSKLFCLVSDGTEPFYFEWLKNGDVLSNSNLPNNYRIDINRDNSLLTIENLSLKDSANYSCRVSNGFGEDYQQIKLIVKGRIDLVV
ncbi:transient receptor potential ion channel subfamily C trpgamma-like protein [Sarcoptes scabiei]|nr:transient receptor potential ion channel subfamily C trpgamma-like protein [Sarcoptes scabiei]